MNLVEVEGLTKTFAGLVAVSDVSFAVRPGEIVALIGPNGAGKTTCFNMIAGALPPTSGTVRFDERVITGLAPEQIARRGISRTFQVVRPMLGMTVEENAMVGALACGADFEQARSSACEAMREVGLEAKAKMLAQNLTLPDRKMLELARTLAMKPRLLLLDEVMAGLRPVETNRIIDVLRAKRESGLTIVLIEHVMRVVMSLADRIIVLHHGEKIAEGSPREISTDARVIESYLGSRAKVR